MGAVKLLCLFLCLLCNTFAFRPLRVCYDDEKTLPRSSHSYSSVQDATWVAAVAGFGALNKTTTLFDLQVFFPLPSQGRNVPYPHVRVQSFALGASNNIISSTFSNVGSTRFEPTVAGMSGTVISSFPYNPDDLLGHYPGLLLFSLNTYHNDTPVATRVFPDIVADIKHFRSGVSPIVDPVHRFGTRKPGVYVFGGFSQYNKTRTYYDTVITYYTEEPTPSPSFIYRGVTGTPPSPRANYGALSIIVVSRYYALYFGGDNGTHYFNDLFQLEITPSAPNITWTRRDPSPDPTFGLPSPRTGFAMNFAREEDLTAGWRPRDFYIFGGFNGTTYFNDFWKYQYDLNQWTRLDDQNFRATIAPRAWHKGVSFFNGSYTNGNYLIYFGGKYADGSPAMFSAVELFNDSDTSRCPYLCTNSSSATTVGLTDICTKYKDLPPLDSSMNSACVSFEECMLSFNCPSGTTQCGLQCLSTDSLATDYGSLSWCARQRPACAASKLACWNGECVDSQELCPVFPPCPINYRRCNGGSCVPLGGSCSVPSPCVPSQELCFDGTCRAPGMCPRTAGCLPSEKNLQCPDGRCVADASECNTSASCSNGQVQCWEGTCDGAVNCSMPNWVQPLRPAFLASDAEGIFGLDVEPLRNANLFKIPFPFYGLVQKPKATTFQTKHTPQSVIASIGPEPTWNKEFDPSYITSAVPTLTVTGVVPIKADNTVFLLLRHQPNLQYAPVPEGNVIDRQKYCLAKAVPWYWSDVDVSSSNLTNVSYISRYSAWNMSSNSSSVTVPDFGQPLLRWKCMAAGYPNSSALNRWPNTYELPAMFPDRMTGIVLLEDLTDTPVAIIRREGAPIIVELGVQPAVTNKDAHFIIDGVIAVTFVVLIIVVIFKACCARNT